MLHFNHNIHHNKTVVKPKHYYYCRFFAASENHQYLPDLGQLAEQGLEREDGFLSVVLFQMQLPFLLRSPPPPGSVRQPRSAVGAEEIFLSRFRHIPSTDMACAGCAGGIVFVKFCKLKSQIF